MVKNEHILTFEMENPDGRHGHLLRLVLPGCFAIISLLIIGQHNYLLFHTLVELGSVAVAWGVFILVWNARRLQSSPAFVMLGIGYMIVGVLDLLHTLAYEGMGVFPGAGADLATQLWISARLIQAAALFLFPFSFNVAGFCRWGGLALATAASIIISCIFAWNCFPECFNAETGLTTFKIASEYIVMGALAGSMFFTYRKRKLIGWTVALFLSGAMLVTIISEFCFTLYTSPFGLANMIGHLFKVVSLMLIYRALIVESLDRPLETLAHGLRKEAERYALIIETSVDGFWIVDRLGRICDVNASAEKLTGLSRDTLLSKRIIDIDANKTAEEIAGHMEKVVANGHDLFETRHRQKDGSCLDVEVSCSFLPYDNGQFIVFVRDISERKSTEDLLRSSEARYRGIVSVLPDLLFNIDSELKFTDVQTSVPEMLLVPMDKIIGKTVWEILPPEIARLTWEKVRETLEGGKMQVYHYSLNMGGVIMECETRMVPCNSGEVLAIVRDVTEARTIERRLRESEERYNAIVNGQTELICRFDAKGTLNFVNDAYGDYFDLPATDLIGQCFFRFVSEKERAFVEQQFLSLTREHPAITYEQQMIDANGKNRWMEWTVRAIYDDRGDVSAYQAVGRDITERKILEQNLMKASEREQIHLARELHDGLCQDLKGLEIQAALLEDGISNTDKELKELAADLSEGINIAVRRAYGITQGMFPTNLESIGFSEALRELAARMVRNRETRITINVQDDLSPLNLSQAHQLYRIAQEALSNNLHHSKATEIELVWQEENNCKVLSVRDNGIGIGNRNIKTPGGLGLQVMSSRAQSINADLTVRDLEQSGTEVRVRLNNE